MSPALLPKSTSWVAPGAGITPDDIQASSTSKWIFTISISILSIYNAVELAVMVFLTFRQYRGLYFCSLLVAGLAIIPYELGFCLDLLSITPGASRWAAISLITLGWWPMVTGQAVVLWSRLHLILMGAKRERIIRWTGWMIVINVFILHLPTTVLTYGSNGNSSPEKYANGYNVMEKIQMAGFFCQEMILSTIYITETSKLLRTSLQPTARTTMRQLIAVNAAIILLDLGLLGMEAASLYILETVLKGVVYSIKLKLELAVLGKLVQIAGGSPHASEQNSYGNVSSGLSTSDRRRRKWASVKDHEEARSERDIGEAVNLHWLGQDVPGPSHSASEYASPRIHARGRRADGSQEYQFARFEHVEDVVSLQDCSV